MEPLKPIHVFWIDDQHEEMRPLKVEAKQHGIILHPFKSAEEGLPELERDPLRYDAVLFDALFFKRKDQERGTEELDGLRDAIAKVNQIKGRKAFRPFILTGQERLEKNNDFKASFGEFYSKRNPDDVQRLFRDLRTAAETMPDTQIRHRYERVFEVCTERYIGEAAAADLLSMLRLQNDFVAGSGTNPYFVSIRKILEDLFTACNREGLVPKAFMPSSGALNETGGFLAVRAVRGYKLKAGVVPQVVAGLIGSLLNYVQPAAHRAQIDEHLKLVGSPYLLHSLTYMLMDVLLWFKSFADTPHEQPLFEKAEQKAPLHKGPIEKDGVGNFHCGEYSLPTNKVRDGYELGDIIIITDSDKNTNPRSMQRYPQFAKRFHRE